MSEQIWKFRKALLVGAAALALAACSSGGGGGGGGAGADQDGDLGLVNPGDANAMMQALGVKLGGQNATMVDGDPPASDPDNVENPEVTEVTPEGGETTVKPGETKELQVEVDTKGDSVFAVLYAKVSGANSYFRATQDGSAETASFKVTQKQGGSLVLEFDIPLKSDSGRFCVEISAGDNADRVSPTQEVCFDIQTDEFSAATVIRGLQGAWERCFADGGGFRKERLDIVGRVVNFSESFHQNSGCPGEGAFGFADLLKIDIGRQIDLASGEKVNELDFTVLSSPEENVGSTSFSILKLDAANGQFRIGEGDDEGSTPEDRATTLETLPYNRVSRATRTLFGSWKPAAGNDDEADLLLLNFLRDGTYTHAQVDLQNRFPDEMDGMEWGFYQFNALTGEITVQAIFDNNGDIGLNDPDGPNELLKGSISGDQLIISDIDNEESVTLVRQPSDGLLGAWLMRDRAPGELVLINFFSGAYVLHEVDPDSLEEFSGLEWSSYEVDPTTGALMVIQNFIDQNSDAGLTDGGAAPDAAFFTEVNGNVLTIEVDEGPNGEIDEVVIFDRQ